MPLWGLRRELFGKLICKEDVSSVAPSLAVFCYWCVAVWLVDGEIRFMLPFMLKFIFTFMFFTPCDCCCWSIVLSKEPSLCVSCLEIMPEFASP